MEAAGASCTAGGLAMKGRKLFLQLGRVGDILNVLPLAWDHHERTGERPLFMVSRDFAHVLDAVSYVEPMIFDGPFEQVMPAAWLARKETEDIAFCQIYGQGLVAPQRCSSFAREAWAQGGSPTPWGSLPLSIDVRSEEREEALRVRILGERPDDRPLVLFALNGHSSPFPFRKALKYHLESNFGSRFRIVDLSDVRAERFTDLLGIFERAKLLVAIDTGHQHLAAACPDLHVVSLVTRDPSGWHGSPWRDQHVARLYYDEFPRILAEPELGIWSKILTAPRRARFIHAWADWRTGPDPDTERRNAIARASWELEALVADWTDAELRHAPGIRTGRSIGDPHDLHFIRDAVEHAVAGAESGAIVALTNADTCFAPGLSGKIADHVRRNGCGFAHRYDVGRLAAPFIHESAVRSGKFYPGTDLFFFTVGWWKQWKHLLGDYVAGREGWDEGFRQLIKYAGGRGIDHGIYHERHAAFWESGDPAGNAHNRRLREEWFGKTGFVPEDYRYFSCIERDPCAGS